MWFAQRVILWIVYVYIASCLSVNFDESIYVLRNVNETAENLQTINLSKGEVVRFQSWRLKRIEKRGKMSQTKYSKVNCMDEDIREELCELKDTHWDKTTHTYEHFVLRRVKNCDNEDFDPGQEDVRKCNLARRISRSRSSIQPTYW